LWLTVLISDRYALAGSLVAGSLAYDTNSIADAEQIQIAQSLQQGADEQSHSTGDAQKGIMFDEGSASDLTRQDELLAVSAGFSDGAIGFIHQRIASEEQFNQRLQQLLTKSTLETQKKQEQLVAMQQQLRKTLQEQTKQRSSFLSKLANEVSQLAQERSHAETLSNQLRKAGSIVGIERNTIKLLHKRTSTLLSQLMNVTRRSKTMERVLADETSKDSIKDHQIVALQHEVAVEQRVPLHWKAKLHKAQVGRASDEAQMKAMERENFLLKQQMLSLSQRDRTLRDENQILRKQLRGTARKEEKETSELDEAKTSLVEAQKSIDKYADSLKSLLNARGDGVVDESSLSSEFTLASVPSSDDFGASVEDNPTIFMQREHTSRNSKPSSKRKMK